jgi:hypothetical protein
MSWRNQFTVGRTWPALSGYDATATSDFDPYTWLSGLGFRFGTVADPTYVIGLDAEDSTWIGYPADPAVWQGGRICGEALPVLDAAWLAVNTDKQPDQPLGPVTVMFRRGPTAFESSKFGVAPIMPGLSPWTDTPEDNVLVTPLDSDGSDLASAVALSSLSVENISFTGLYDFGGDQSDPPALQPLDGDFWVFESPAYGFRLEHADPGNENPYSISLGVVAVFADLGPTYLRQRQSPRYSPSRNAPVNLRQRQTPFITR